MNSLTLKDIQLSIGSILSHSWTLYREHFRIILELTLLVSIPINIGLEFVPLEWYLSSGDPFEVFSSYSRIVQILEAIIGVIATIGIVIAIESVLKDRKHEPGFAETLQHTMTRWPAAIATNILTAILVMGLAILLIVPGLIALVYWQFMVVVVAIRNRHSFAALEYSKNMISGRWWQVLGYTLVFALIIGVLMVITGAISWYLPGDMLTNVVFYTLADIIFAYFTVVSTVFFLALEKTKK